MLHSPLFPYPFFCDTPNVEPVKRKTLEDKIGKAEMPAAANPSLPGPDRTSAWQAALSRLPGEGLDVMLTKEELAAKLKVSVRSIENWKHDGYLPFLKIANVVRFHWPTVLTQLSAKPKT